MGDFGTLGYDISTQIDLGNGFARNQEREFYLSTFVVIANSVEGIVSNHTLFALPNIFYSAIDWTMRT